VFDDDVARADDVGEVVAPAQRYTCLFCTQPSVEVIVPPACDNGYGNTGPRDESRSACDVTDTPGAADEQRDARVVGKSERFAYGTTRLFRRRLAQGIRCNRAGDKNAAGAVRERLF